MRKHYPQDVAASVHRAGLARLVAVLTSVSAHTFWRTGVLLLQLGTEVALLEDGQLLRITRYGPEALEAGGLPRLAAVSPLALVAGGQGQLTLTGTRLTAPGTQLLARCGGATYKLAVLVSW